MLKSGLTQTLIWILLLMFFALNVNIANAVDSAQIYQYLFDNMTNEDICPDLIIVAGSINPVVNSFPDGTNKSCKHTSTGAGTDFTMQNFLDNLSYNNYTVEWGRYFNGTGTGGVASLDNFMNYKLNTSGCINLVGDTADGNFKWCNTGFNGGCVNTGATVSKGKWYSERLTKNNSGWYWIINGTVEAMHLNTTADFTNTNCPANGKSRFYYATASGAVVVYMDSFTVYNDSFVVVPPAPTPDNDSANITLYNLTSDGGDIVEIFTTKDTSPAWRLTTNKSANVSVSRDNSSFIACSICESLHPLLFNSFLV